VTSPRFIPLLLAAGAAPAHAAEADPGLAGSLGQMVIGLAVVVGLLLATLWLIKRLSMPRGATAGLKVLGAVAVGQRERVVLVEMAGQVLVLGVTPGSVRTLHVLPADVFHTESGAAAAGAGAAPGDFSGWLRQSLERRRDAR